MARMNVGVVRGGVGEYDTSLKTGAAVLAALPEDDYEAHDIFVDKRGTWHMRGMPVDPMRALRRTDVVFNALRGGEGEGGAMQRILERSGIPYTGSQPHITARALNKGATRDALRGTGMSMPGYAVFTMDDAREHDTGVMAREVFGLFGPPYIVKPLRGGSGMGIVLSRTLPELPDTLADALEEYGEVIVEEFIPGEEVSSGVLEHFRGHDLYTLPPVLVIPHESRPFFDYEARLEGLVSHHCPAPLSFKTKAIVEEYAALAHSTLGLSHYSNSDFIVHPSGRVYLLEVNTLPSLTEHAHFPHALGAIGSSISDFVTHSLKQALARS